MVGENGNLAPRGPVFILGAPRTGTTILASALRSVGYSGFSEGHLLNLLVPLSRLIERHFAENDIRDPDILLSNVHQQELLDDIIQILKKTQVSFNQHEPWLDKTPGADMIYAVPTLSRLWPTAMFVFVKRRGIETITSRLKKFPDETFDYHCAAWSDSMAAWRTIRATGIDNLLEVDQYDIAHDREVTAEKIGGSLRLSPSQIRQLCDEMQNSRPQSTDEQSAHRVLTLQTCGWTAEQVAWFRGHCTREMEAYGYGFDEQYRTS